MTEISEAKSICNSLGSKADDVFLIENFPFLNNKLGKLINC